MYLLRRVCYMCVCSSRDFLHGRINDSPHPFKRMLAVLQSTLTKDLKFIVCPSSVLTFLLTLTNSMVLGEQFCTQTPAQFPNPNPNFPSTKYPRAAPPLSPSVCNQLEFKECQEQVEQFFQGSEEPFDSCNFSGSGTGWGSGAEEAHSGHWWRPHWHWHRQGGKGGVCYGTSVPPPCRLHILCYMPQKVLTALRHWPDMSQSLRDDVVHFSWAV